MKKKVLIGSWITLNHFSIAEIMSEAGFDWLCIDMEHSVIDYFEAQQLIAIIQSKGIKAFVRVGENNARIIKRVLDAGADGIIVPMVNSKEEAIKAIEAVKYPPKGKRGVGLARAQKYGFGWVHSAPIKDNVEAISKYVGKYISKHMGERIKEDKGVRLTSTSKGFINSSTKFAWNTEGGKEWRRKLEKFASLIGIRNMKDMAYVFGPRWAYHWEHSILSVDTITPPEISRFKRIVKKKRAGLKINKMFVMDNDQLMDSTTGEVLF